MAASDLKGQVLAQPARIAVRKENSVVLVAASAVWVLCVMLTAGFVFSSLSALVRLVVLVGSVAAFVVRLTNLACLSGACAVPVSGFNICDRTSKVQDEILNKLSSSSNCNTVTLAQLGVNKLDLKDKDITGLKSGDFDGLTNLVKLKLYMNSLVSLPDGVFDDLTNLERLDLDQNYLESLPDGVFDKLTNLQLLYLVSNRLVSLPDGVFDKLTNLQHLYMGVNDLESLSDGVFDKLTRLQYLSIGSNDLESLPDGVFDKLTELRWLTMSSNNITSLQPGIFEKLLKIEFLYTYGNRFSCIPRNAFGSRTDNLSTITLVYRTPEIGICSTQCGFANQPCCTSSQCTGSLVCAGSGSSATCQDCGSQGEQCCISSQCGLGLVCDANSRLCVQQSQCSSLVGSSCGQAGQLSCCAVSGLACVSGACAVPVSGFNICDRTSKVQDEILNKLSSSSNCNTVTLAQLGNISELDLKDKDITGLKSGDFDGLTNLVKLKLYMNSLVSLPDGVFDDLTNLERLELDQNYLESLPDGVFDRLTNLRLLYLVSNRLVSLPDGVFDGLTNLENLYMGVNDLESLSDGVFDKLTRLQYLSIGSNDLESLPDGVFDKLTKLRWLTMSSNNIASLQPGIFEKLLEIEYLYTYGNRFSCIPRNAFGSRTDNLSTITLVYHNTPEIGICSTQCGFVRLIQPCWQSTQLPQLYGSESCV